MKRLSIIVPCYNVEKYIGRCLNSLMAQTTNDFVVLAIDDGSTDDTFKILQDYQKKYPQRIQLFQKENGGIANTRNYGLALVETEYFGFLDSDDYICETMLEEMLDKAQKTQAEVVVCGFEWTYENNQKKNTVTIEGPYSTGKEMMLGLFATLWNKIYKTSFVKKTALTFPDGYRYEDASFLYRLVPHVRHIEFIEKPFINYVQREGSITHTHNEKVKDMVHVFQDILSYYQKENYYKEYKDELEYIFIRFFLGNSFLRTVQIKDAEDRKITLELSWKMLDQNFPEWKKNHYLSTGELKNLYYKLVNRKNYILFGKIFSLMKRG